MVIKNSEFIKSAVSKKDYPVDNIPEIALAGRSNVGKSSFINKFLMRKNIARVSKTQGKTRLINFFKVNSSFYLVDLPGYGFANVSKKEQMSWGGMIEDYLNERKELVSVFLLLDIRHMPNDDDILMYDYIKARGFAPFIILTKADKIAKTKVPKEAEKFKALFGTDDIYPFSALNGSGREEILEAVSKLVD